MFGIHDIHGIIIMFDIPLYDTYIIMNIPLCMFDIPDIIMFDISSFSDNSRPLQITIHGTRSPGGHAPGARTRLATAQAPDAGGAG